MTNESITQLRQYAMEKTATLDAGPSLRPDDKALINLAVTSSVTTLDRAAIDDSIKRCLDLGATVGQVQEIIALTSGLGVHTLMASEVALLEAACSRGLIDSGRPLDDNEQTLWDKHVGDDPFWTGFSRELPGFLNAMLRLSPSLFEAFFIYCAVPWQSGTVRARIKELAAMACDVSPSHCFGPGFRIHLANAIALGVGRDAIIETLDIAAAAPIHSGYGVSP